MFLDIGVGILAAMAVASLFKTKLTLTLLLGGVCFGLLPDVDFIRYFFLEDKMEGYKHRDTLHLPLLYLPIGTVLVYAWFGQVLAVIFLIASFSHFFHDSMGIGRGIKWLYPFSRNSYAFLYMYSGSVPRGLWKPLFVFDEERIKQFDREHGDPDWLKNVYLKWHPFAIIEFSLFIISLLLLYLYAR
jgi:membrane-bound metal-dependent hydrolase YbcI (DUF457 family)